MLADVFSGKQTVVVRPYQVLLQVIQKSTYTRTNTSHGLLDDPIAQFDPDQVWIHHPIILRSERTPKVEFMPDFHGFLLAAGQQPISDGAQKHTSTKGKT